MRIPRVRPATCRLRAVVLGAAVLVMVAGGLWAGLRMAGPHTYQTALGSLQVEVRPSWPGRVQVYIPLADWGVRAHAFSAPLTVTAEPRGADRPALIATAGGDTALLDEARRDAERVGREAITRALLWALAGGAAGSALAMMVVRLAGRRWRQAVSVMGAGLLLSGLAVSATGVAMAATFDPGAFERPTFFARGAELAQLLQAADNLQHRTKDYTSTVERSLRAFAGLVAGGEQTQQPAGSGRYRRALLASDLHNNVFALSAVSRFARDLPVFWVGDFGHDGNAGERRLLRGLNRIGRRVVAVSGNHDSRALMVQMARGGATVLTRRGRLHPDGTVRGAPVVSVSGLKVAGFEDPLEYLGSDPSDPDRIFSFTERPGGEREYQQAQEGLYRWFRALPGRPDVVLVHQNGLAQSLARRLTSDGYDQPLTILTGHDHQQHIDLYGGRGDERTVTDAPVVVVDAGTVGAGGQFGVGKQSIGVAQLHFDASRPELELVDLVQVEPLSKAAQADRVVIGTPACDQKLVRCNPADGDAAQIRSGRFGRRLAATAHRPLGRPLSAQRRRR